MPQEKGKLSINSENIMPIIKKWLYSDSDIFVRELVSNATDAVSKHQRLVGLGEAEASEEKYRVDVKLDKENKTITVSDNGIGMTADEIRKYINQIAFSGANDFVEKYKSDGEGNDIIGHFGLGFYSAFMVAERVVIDTLSYQTGAEAARWESDGTTEYELTEGSRAERGTDITLFVNEDSSDYLDAHKLRETILKYCGFFPVEIYFTEAGAEQKEDGEPNSINDSHPLWTKKPSDCTEDEYKKFYHQVFMDYNEPLFWIHLNIDYPFRLKGILYFPKLKHELESIEGQVKLFNNQVFIAENIKEVIPDFLLLLKGAIDCPDLPLNVSRSFLQNDGFVTKMSGYITRKVADKLNSVFNENRDQYNKNWDDINQFIKYGCIRDKDFYERVKGSLIYKTLNNEYLNIGEYLERNKDKQEGKVFYATDEQQQSQYIKLFKAEGIEAVLMTTRLDNPFMSYVEGYEKDFKFTRIDADLSDALKNGEASEEDDNAFGELFRQVLPGKEIKLKSESLKNDEVSAVILLSEESRRMKEMSAMFGPGFDASMFKDESTLVLNRNNSLIQALMRFKDDEARREEIKLICEHIYDLAMLSHKPLSVEEMDAFVSRSQKLMGMLL